MNVMADERDFAPSPELPPEPPKTDKVAHALYSLFRWSDNWLSEYSYLEEQRALEAYETVRADLDQAREDRVEEQESLAQFIRLSDAERRAHDATIKTLLIRMRHYMTRHDVQMGECVAWNALKQMFTVGQREGDDERWLETFEAEHGVQP